MIQGIFLSNLKITYCCLKIKIKLLKLQLEHNVNNQDCQIPGLSQIVDKISSLRMERSLVKFVGFSKGGDQNDDRVPMNDKMPYLHL